MIPQALLQLVKAGHINPHWARKKIADSYPDDETLNDPVFVAVADVERAMLELGRAQKRLRSLIRPGKGKSAA